MNDYLKLQNKYIPIKYHEAFKERATITFDLDKFKDMDFLDVLHLLKTTDINKLEFYYTETLMKDGKEVETEHKLFDEWIGYTKLVTYVNNYETGMATITLDKPNATNMDIEEIKEMVDKQIVENEQKLSINYIAQVMALTLTDEQALNCIDLFPAYAVGKKYVKGDRFKYEGLLYKVLQEHTSQADWKPNENKTLYLNVADPSIEFPEFKQPTGAHDAYMKGDKVTFEGKHYISKLDNNTYSPADYPSGWDLVQ